MKLKALTLIAAMLAATTPAVAEDDVCVSISEVAEAIMMNRQIGVPLVDMMRIAADNQMLRILTMEAYKMPRFNGEEHQERAVQDFTDRVTLECYKQVGEPT